MQIISAFSSWLREGKKVILIDGLGTFPFDIGEKQKLETIVPTSTVPILSSLYSLQPVEVHGLFEWSLYFPEFDAVKEVFRIQEYSGKFLFPRGNLSSFGVKHILPKRILKGAYSKAAFHGCEVLPYTRFSEALTLLKKIQAPALLYYEGLDDIGHRYGIESDEFEAELEFLRENLSAVDNVVVIGDHGLIEIKETFEHPQELEDYLAKDYYGNPIPPFGGPRFIMYKSPVPEELVDFLNETLAGFGKAFLWEEIEKKYFPAEKSPLFRLRKSDVVFLPEPSVCLKAEKCAASHGGDTPEERMVYAWHV